MRLIKENTQSFESFHKSLQYFTKNTEAKGDLKLISFENHKNNNNVLEKYSFFVQNLFSFQKRIQQAKGLSEIHLLTSEFVKKVLHAKEVEIFLFNDSNRHLIPINKDANPVHINAINKVNKDGILDWIFESKKPTIVPELNSYTISGSKINQIVFPIYNSKGNYGVLSIYSPVGRVPEDSLENKSIQIVLGVIVPIIITMRQKNAINKLYQELQVYQSKIQNDFDIYAIGNLAEGILEEIGEPLQVILSLSDLIENDNDNVDKEITENIKKQVHKVNELTNRLTKFTAINKAKPTKVQSCNVNKLIKEFRNIINATLQNLGLECELDLEENIPPILSDPAEVKQILTSIFSLLKPVSRNGDAFVIQTKYLKEKVVVSVFSTENVEEFSKNSENVSVKLINELMKKNEGFAEFSTLPLKGTIIHLVFPLKRKLAL